MRRTWQGSPVNVTTFKCKLTYFKGLSTVFGTDFFHKAELGIQRTLRASDTFKILYASDQSTLQMNAILGPSMSESRLDQTAR